MNSHVPFRRDQHGSNDVRAIIITALLMPSVYGNIAGEWSSVATGVDHVIRSV